VKPAAVSEELGLETLAVRSMGSPTTKVAGPPVMLTCGATSLSVMLLVEVPVGLTEIGVTVFVVVPEAVPEVTGEGTAAGDVAGLPAAWLEAYSGEPAIPEVTSLRGRPASSAATQAVSSVGLGVRPRSCW
jgi:hypothetical protein